MDFSILQAEPGPYYSTDTPSLVDK